MGIWGRGIRMESHGDDDGLRSALPAGSCRATENCFSLRSQLRPISARPGLSGCFPYVGTHFLYRSLLDRSRAELPKARKRKRYFFSRPGTVRFALLALVRETGLVMLP